MSEKRQHSFRRALWLIPVLILLAACVLYVKDYYHADPSAEALLSGEIPGVTILREEGKIVFCPEKPRAGLIFYPGGKVEFTAYAPLMAELSERGFLCVLLKMPLNLAVLDINAADRVYSAFPEVDEWLIAGHSLGGSMAAVYAAGHSDRLEGLVLLAAWSPVNLKENDLKVMSIFGSEDGVLDRNKYEKYFAKLPEDTEELIIPGGCHAYFGAYGAQDGDGQPEISDQEQIRVTADAVSEFWNNAGKEAD